LHPRKKRIEFAFRFRRGRWRPFDYLAAAVSERRDAVRSGASPSANRRAWSSVRLHVSIVQYATPLPFSNLLRVR